MNIVHGAIMTHVVDTNAMLSEGILTEAQVSEIIRRSRATMLALVTNILLTAGIIAAALGFVFWIADPVGVAILGLVFLVCGAAVLFKNSQLYSMLGNAAALVGAGMLFSGAAFELAENYEHIAEWILIPLGAVSGLVAAWVFTRVPDRLRFSVGSVGLMGLALHLFGVILAVDNAALSGWPMSLISLYGAVTIAAAGLFLNVRFVTALAIVPFAQMLSTGTAYFHAAYVFYSPEPTLTIFQMLGLVLVCLWVGSRYSDRIARHTSTTSVMAMIVASLAFLVGSLWGDNVGEYMLREGRPAYNDFNDWSDYSSALEEWRSNFLHISEHVFSVVFAVVLIAAAWWSAMGARRGLFNTAVTFLGIHAYTQMFETFSDEPMAWALGGLALIPLAWGMWRLNDRLFG